MSKPEGTKCHTEDTTTVEGKSFTIGMIIIGNEILSGRTQDKNTRFLGEQMAKIGYSLTEVRIIPDDESLIISTVRELKEKYSVVFTSGGIGPTHDDITSESIAKALGRKYDINQEALTILEEFYKSKNQELNSARLKMAKMPENAELIENEISSAPGFKVDNIYVFAGVPSIFESMTKKVASLWSHRSAFVSSTVLTYLTEGLIATSLAEVQNSCKDTSIGSYPRKDEKNTPCVHVVIRGQSQESVAQCVEKVEAKLGAISKIKDQHENWN